MRVDDHRGWYWPHSAVPGFDFHFATSLAIAVVVVELVAISWIRWRYMDTPFLAASFQVIVGGILVFLAGWAIGAG
jgi:hypothetical protein